MNNASEKQARAAGNRPAGFIDSIDSDVARQIAMGWLDLDREGPKMRRAVARIVSSIERSGDKPICNRAVKIYRAACRLLTDAQDGAE